MCKGCNPKYTGPPKKSIQAAEVSREEFLRGDHDEDVLTAGKRRSKRKDTGKWCKGKVGREHVWKIAKTNWAINQECKYYNGVDWRTGESYRHWKCWHLHVCANCGKHGDEWFGLGTKCPDFHAVNA